MVRLAFSRPLMIAFGIFCTWSTLHGQTVTRAGTTVTVTGTSAVDSVVVTFTPPSSVTVSINGNSFNFARNQIRLMVVRLGAGADSFVGTTCPFNLEVSGGLGNDTIRGGRAADVLNGEADNDSIFGGPGIDSLDGGAGSDFLDGGDNDDGLSGGNGRDILVGGGGIDALNGEGSEDLLIGGTLSPASVPYVKSTWYAPTQSFSAKLTQFSLVPPVVVQDPLTDFVAGGDGRDLFLANIFPPIEPEDPALDELIDFVEGVDADYTDLLPPIIEPF